MILSIDPNRPVKELGDLFGVFFEDLNHAADGGLYAELIQNRSFEFEAIDNSDYHPLYAWEKVERGDSSVQLHVETSRPINEKNKKYLTMEITRKGEGAGIRNLGFAGGIWLEKGKKYGFSCWYARISSKAQPVRVGLENEAGESCSTEAIFLTENQEWTKVELKLTATKTGSAFFYLLSNEVQTIWLDMVSLFPEDTFNGRKNGLRTDIAKLISDMKPKFVRFPGGCLVHCGSLNAEDRVSQYRWKNTLGPVEKRPTKRNTWNYNQTLGLGYYEFFCFCEDIGAQPLPVISAGYDPHTLRAAPLDKMQEWIDEALDLIEFANGSADTKWGAIRTSMGNPKPFGLVYLGIGNEETGDGFFERFEIIHKAVKERYPDIQLIGTSGPGCGGEVFCQGWESARKMGSSYVDEHYYQSTEWFLANMHRYDGYPSDGPKAFLGEYASKDEKYYNALVEAAFMTEMEKAPGLGLACYAPMLCNANYVNWKPDMIWFDNHRVYGTPCYQVQKLFMNHQGDQEVFSKLTGVAMPEIQTPDVSGGIRFHADTPFEVSLVRVENLDTGEVILYNEFELDENTHEVTIAQKLDWQRYTISFTAKRLGTSNVEQAWPLQVQFAWKDSDNYLAWSIEGWTQTSSIMAIQNGNLSDLGLYYAPKPTKTNIEYTLKVENGQIEAIVDGVSHEKVEYRLPVVEELYYTASTEIQSGDLIIKAVNLKSDPVSVELDLKDTYQKNVDVWELSGYKKDDVNTFEEPMKVVPKRTCMELISNRFTVAPESVTILRFHGTGVRHG